MQYIAYRNLIGVSHTEEEAKAEAEEQMIQDGPNDKGEMFTFDLVNYPITSPVHIPTKRQPGLPIMVLTHLI